MEGEWQGEERVEGEWQGEGVGEWQGEKRVEWEGVWKRTVH